HGLVAASSGGLAVSGGTAAGSTSDGTYAGTGSCFVSCRRRHTRSKRDWSSDVCASDLAGGTLTGVPFVDAGATLTATGGTVSGRSEERRVGKECRSRWSQDQ